jgi:hypothetical protein
MKEQPECKVDKYGNKRWYLNGEWHREDGPAVEGTNGTKQWFLHGKRHREDGPAYVSRGGRTRLWWLHDEPVDPETLVDLWLSRGIFCYYDEEANELRFDA